MKNNFKENSRMMETIIENACGEYELEGIFFAHIFDKNSNNACFIVINVPKTSQVNRIENLELIKHALIMDKFKDMDGEKNE